MDLWIMKHFINKLKLIQSGKLKNACAVCGLGPEWQEKELILILDYINGVQTDDRLSNLRLLCPNCNSQQYNVIIKGQLMQKSNPKKPCERCGMPTSVNTKSGVCKRCTSVLARKVEWPSKEVIETDMEVLSMRAIGRKYKVSDNTVRRWAKQYNLLKG